MSEKIKVACVQFECGKSAETDAELVKRNIERAGELTRKAAKEGAKIVLLSELFERQYFCQERRYDYYEYATEILENPAVKYFSELCKELEEYASKKIDAGSLEVVDKLSHTIKNLDKQTEYLSKKLS